MRSEPPIPTRAPGKQFRSMSILETPAYKIHRVGVGGSYSIGGRLASGFWLMGLDSRSCQFHVSIFSMVSAPRGES